MTESDNIPMPEWASPAGPWCLKQWLPLPGKNWNVCVLDPSHKGDCRLSDGRWTNQGNGMFLGQLEMRKPEDDSLEFYEVDH